MNIVLDISPLQTGHFLQHRVRGTGFYVNNLKASLLKYYPQNKYIFFTRGQNVPKIVDVVHIPYFEPFFLTLPMFKRYKTVVTVHDLTPLVFSKQFPSGLRGKIKWEVQKRLLQKADAIIADSNCSKRDVVKYTGIAEEKIHGVYLAAGKEFEKIKNQKSKIKNLRERYNLPEKFVFYVGDVTWNKNLPRLISAIQKINLTLVMVGKALVDNYFDRSSPWNQDLVKIQTFAEKDRRIIRLGFVPTEDLVLLYNLATVFVMPSLYEGFGLPILEAMSCGCPVVTTKEGSLPEIAANAAQYVDAYDINDIANGIGEVFFNKGLQEKLSKEGLKQAKKFSWERTAREVINIYETVCQ